MTQHAAANGHGNLAAIKALTFLMFMMFAMTTDSVGVIIPEIIKQFRLSMTAAGAFQYATMGGIALAGFFLGLSGGPPGPQDDHRDRPDCVRRGRPTCLRSATRSPTSWRCWRFPEWPSASSRPARWR